MQFDRGTPLEPVFQRGFLLPSVSSQLGSVYPVQRERRCILGLRGIRTGRSVRSLIELVEGLEADGIHFVSLTDAVDTTVPSGRFFFHVMASLARMERELTVERTRAGLVVAKNLGRIGGRPRKRTPAKVDSAKTLLAQGTLVRDIAESLGVSVPTLYRWLPADAGARGTPPTP